MGGSRTTGHPQAFPPLPAVPRDAVTLAGQGGCEGAAGVRRHSSARRCCAPAADLAQPEMGRACHHQQCVDQGSSSQENTAPLLFLHCTSQGLCHVPFPSWFPCPAPSHRVSDPFSGETRLGRKGPLSPAHSSPRHPKCPKCSRSAPPRALQPPLSPGQRHLPRPAQVEC